MIKTSVAEASRDGDDISSAAIRALHSREERALRLFCACGDQIRQVGPNIYECPSQDGERVYTVVYGSEDESCQCLDHLYRDHACVHMLAAAVKHAKRRAKRRRAFTTSLAVEISEEES